jgi:crotonobetainyl-CoA:carnitine CoA-transferase CaiB-like acyl-CoA transferase
MSGIETPTVRSPSPDLGQHSDEVLGEAGLSADEIAVLRQAGVVS